MSNKYWFVLIVAIIVLLSLAGSKWAYNKARERPFSEKHFAYWEKVFGWFTGIFFIALIVLIAVILKPTQIKF